jgi:hypothetical protein
MLSKRFAHLIHTPLPLLRELRRECLLEFFLREQGDGHQWDVWVFSFPALAYAASDRSEMTCLSWLVAEAFPSDAPQLARSIVLEAERGMRIRVYGLPPH